MHYDIFISYRRNKTADKAEHLLSLLSGAGYRGKVSFDKDNLAGRFDMEILNRVDSCKDFIMILGKDTFSYLSEGEDDSELYKRIADCTAEEFPVLEAQLRRVDFVRVELARAIRKGKNIIPVVPVDSDDYSFSKLSLPEDIAALTRFQAVFYSDKDNCFLFQDILPKITTKLKTKPAFGAAKRIGFPLWLAILAACIIAGLYLVMADWVGFQNSATRAQLEAYIGKTSSPVLFKGKAKARVDELTGIEKKLKAIDYFSGASFSDEITVRKAEAIVKIARKMIYVPGGDFIMGTDDMSANPKCRPAHTETASELLLGKYELSEDEWNTILGKEEGRQDYPVTGITWYEALEFCTELEKLTGIPFTLPYEKEWEFAAGYGDHTIYSGSDIPDDVAWYSGKEGAGDMPHARNDKKGNLDCNYLEIYDMSGNVAEWCADDFSLYGEEPESDRNKVIRGGSVADGEKKIRITYRDPMEIGSSSKYVGLRLAVYL